MINKAECYQNALQQVKNRRHRAIETADNRRDELYASNPALLLLKRELVDLTQRIMQEKINRGHQLTALEEEYQELKHKEKELLSSLGYRSEDFKPQFACSLCQDTGITDTGVCRCVKHLAHSKMLQQLCEELPNQSYSFDTFSLSYYSGEEREHMSSVYETCLSYAQNFTRDSESLYILGNTGLGKTHLTFAIAKEVVSKGFSVIYCSTQSMITALEKEHFGQLEEPVRDYYCTCDLLILDDLGTEYLSQVASAELYNVINQRILLNRPTIINSNLTPKELESRYGERLVSRIFGCYKTMKFLGKDIRIQKRLASKKL